MSKVLKIKAKYLAEEARIIRKEEKKCLKEAKHHRQRQDQPMETKSLWEFTSLRDHRIKIVRPISRYAHIARAYIAGRSYKETEQPKEENRLSLYQIKQIAKDVIKYRDVPRYGFIYPRATEEAIEVEVSKILKWLVADG